MILFDEKDFMSRLQDDREIALIVIETFLSDAPDQLQKLQTSLDTNHVKNAEITAHAIKGAAANISAPEVREIAFEMEKSAKAGMLDAVRVQMDPLRKAIAELTVKLQEWSAS